MKKTIRLLILSAIILTGLATTQSKSMEFVVNATKSILSHTTNTINPFGISNFGTAGDITYLLSFYVIGSIALAKLAMFIERRDARIRRAREARVIGPDQEPNPYE